MSIMVAEVKTDLKEEYSKEIKIRIQKMIKN